MQGFNQSEFNKVYEELYPKIKNNQHIICCKFQLKEQDQVDIESDCYLWALEAYKNYDPIKYPNVPLDGYIMSSVIAKLKIYYDILNRRKYTYQKRMYTSEQRFKTFVKNELVSMESFKNEDGETFDFIPTYDNLNLEQQELLNIINKFESKRRTILIMILQGYTQWDIANYLNMSQPGIQQIIRSMRKAVTSNNKRILNLKESKELYEYLKIN